MIYELWLHDFGSLESQLLDISEDKEKLEKIADNGNYIFSLNGYKSLQFEVMLSEIESVEG